MQAGGRSTSEDVWSDGERLAQGGKVTPAPDAEPHDSITQETDETPPSQTSDSDDEYVSPADTSSQPSYSARGNDEFLGRTDISVAADGTITFSMDPNDESVQQLASDILKRLQQ